MKYEMHQIAVDEYIDRQNKFKTPEHETAWRDALLLAKPERAMTMRMYRKVAIIETGDLEGVFEIGNIGPDSRIFHLRPMRSVSVGDLVFDENGDRWVVAPVGFDQLPG